MSASTIWAAIVCLLFLTFLPLIRGELRTPHNAESKASTQRIASGYWWFCGGIMLLVEVRQNERSEIVPDSAAHLGVGVGVGVGLCHR